MGVPKAAQIGATLEYAKAYPCAGRPGPERSFKQTLANLEESGVWDMEGDDEALAPQLMS